MTEAVYTSVIEFRVREGHARDFVAAFHACGMLERPHALDGYLSGELLQQEDDPACFIVIAHWRTPDAYAEWGRLSRTGVDPQALAAFAACLVDIKAGRLFRASR